MNSPFNLGGGEIILFLTLVLILLGAKRLPDITRTLGKGVFEFRKASRKIAADLDEEASDAGKSFGGINGGLAFEGLSPDNRVAELYDPAFLGQKPFRYRRFSRWCALLARRVTTIISCVFRKLAFWHHDDTPHPPQRL